MATGVINDGSEKVMTGRPFTGPTDLTLSAHRMHIEGYPDAERLVRLVSPLAKRLSDLRLHQGALTFCEKAMHEFNDIRQSSQVGAEAMLIGIVTRYFSCFGDNKASTPLNHKNIFAGMDGASDCFMHWKNVRNKLMVHNESELSHISTCLVLGKDAEVQDVLSYMHVTDFVYDDHHCQILYNLIDTSLKYVIHEIDKLMPRLFAEARALPTEERASLADMTLTVAGWDQASVTRAKTT